jgi:hypothetical protein
MIAALALLPGFQLAGGVIRLALGPPVAGR